MGEDLNVGMRGDGKNGGRKLPRLGEVWRHFKGANYYIIGVAEHTETKEKFVIYCKSCEYQNFARPLEMFMSEVDREKYPSVKQKYRFERVRKDD